MANYKLWQIIILFKWFLIWKKEKKLRSSIFGLFILNRFFPLIHNSSKKALLKVVTILNNTELIVLIYRIKY